MGPHAHRGRPALHGVDGPLCRARRGWGQSTVPPTRCLCATPACLPGCLPVFPSFLIFPFFLPCVGFCPFPASRPPLAVALPSAPPPPHLPSSCWDTASAQRRPCFLPALSPPPAGLTLEQETGDHGEPQGTWGRGQGPRGETPCVWSLRAEGPGGFDTAKGQALANGPLKAPAPER